MSARHLTTRVIAVAAALGLAACGGEPDRPLSGMGRGRHSVRRPRRAGTHRDAVGARGRQCRGRRAAVHPRCRPAKCGPGHGGGKAHQARQAYERAQQLVRTAAGTQKTLEDAQAALREAEARYNTAQTRLNRRRVASPVPGSSSRSISAPARWCRRAGRCWPCCRRRTLKVRFFVPRGELAGKS